MAKCPECGALIDLDEEEVEEGETFSCPECAADLEVVNTHPLELGALADEDEEEDEAEELLESDDEDELEDEDESDE